MYRVIEAFEDKQDGHRYNAGDKYPRTGANPSKSRIKELAGDKNRRGIPLIEEVESPDSDE
jgi:hypothetical protein